MAVPIDQVAFTLGAAEARPPPKKEADITGLIVAGALIVGFILMAKGR